MKRAVQTLLSLSLSLGVIQGQLAGTATENQPAITVQECSSSSCTTIPTSVTIDANWRWAHTTSGTNCYTGNNWNSDICSDPVNCANSCVVEGATNQQYKETYGVTTAGSQVNLGFVTVGPYSTNVGSRVYLMKDTDTYQMFKLLNKEFTIDVDSSQLDCGLNGALYFVEMAADGGKSEYSGNKAGAKFGTGYCDAQCPHDVKFINGEANSLDWVPSSEDPNSGKGRYGTCCAEMDIWEANKFSTAVTPHPCDVTTQTRCYGTDCGDGDNRYGGVCDKDGCDFNSYRMGNRSFYGPGMEVDSNKPITVVTQFITDDNTDNGNLVEIRRIYKQDGRVIYNSGSTFQALKGVNSITDDMCSAQKALFGDTDDFVVKGGLKRMGESLKRGMVLAMSLWVDYDAHCLWLDSNSPANGNPNTPGVARGSCPITSGVPRDVIAKSPQSTVSYGNIKWGPIGSTTNTGSAPTQPATQKPTQPATQKPTQPATQKPTQPATQKPTQPATQKPTQPATQKPTQPATQAPTQPATQKPTQPATQKPTQPATQKPTQKPTQPATQAPATQKPTQPATQKPTQPATQKPTQPATQKPTQPATQRPTQAPGNCADSISIASTRSGQWSDGVNDYSQWTVSVSLSSTINSLNLATSSAFESYWQVNKQQDGTYTLNDWRLNSNQPIPAGNSFTFGYIKKGLEEAAFTVDSASCGNNLNKRNMDVAEEHSSASIAHVSVVATLVSLIYVFLL